MSNWTDLIDSYRKYKGVSSSLKIATIAQWILESGRGKSDLAKKHYNFGGIKYRDRMKNFANPVEYKASDGWDVYCEFESVENFIAGYWHFIDSKIYADWEQYASDGRAYIKYIADQGYAGGNKAYPGKVYALFEEAAQLLALDASPDDGVEEPPPAKPQPPKAAKVKIPYKKVCIDPGHGMSNRSVGVYDPGATHTEGTAKYEEASIALKYGLTLKDYFRANGVDVYMTRDDAEDPTPVGKRAANAKAAGCDLLISIHLNDYDDDAASGVEVLYGDADDAALAKRVGDALHGATSIKRRHDKLRTDLAVLKFKGPAILLELGFIANDFDRGQLLNTQVRDAVCKAVYEALA